MIDLDVLEKTTTKVMEMLKNTKGLVNIDRDFESGKPQIKINIKRQNTQVAGVSANEIAGVF